jgi:hypothetical protein
MGLLAKARLDPVQIDIYIVRFLSARSPEGPVRAPRRLRLHRCDDRLRLICELYRRPPERPDPDIRSPAHRVVSNPAARQPAPPPLCNSTGHCIETTLATQASQPWACALPATTIPSARMGADHEHRLRTNCNPIFRDPVCVFIERIRPATLHWDSFLVGHVHITCIGA